MKAQQNCSNAIPGGGSSTFISAVGSFPAEQRTRLTALEACLMVSLAGGRMRLIYFSTDFNIPLICTHYDPWIDEFHLILLTSPPIVCEPASLLLCSPQDYLQDYREFQHPPQQQAKQTNNITSISSLLLLFLIHMYYLFVVTVSSSSLFMTPYCLSQC